MLAVAVLAACGSGPTPTGATPGQPQPGGSATYLTLSEPRTLDPAALVNSGPSDGVVGNAIYGELITDDPKTGAVVPAEAASMSSPDGLQWTVKLRTGLKFSDGTAFDAEALQFNWNRHKDPAVASRSAAAAALIASTTVSNPTTLTFTLTQPNGQFAKSVVNSALNWVASPTALKAGPTAFDAKPAGAGPFVLGTWARGDRLTLIKNSEYWDAPRPYVDKLVIKAVSDTQQRTQTLISGGADLAQVTSPQYVAQAQQSGQRVADYPLNGAYLIWLNQRQAPFNDIRARQAVAAAIDMKAVNEAVYGPSGTVPTTLFDPSSPFYDASQTLYTPDRAKAQALFSQLAAEGKPVNFAMVVFNASESIKTAQAVQAQLSGYRNVTVQLQTLDFAGANAKLGSKDFQAAINSMTFSDPEPQLFQSMSSTSPQNFSGVSDPALDAALLKGRTSQDLEARKGAYETVQQRIRELIPALYWTVPEASVVTQASIGGMSFYGNASPRVDTFWTAKSS
ncbi:ABC transporter substrate-binding protein [Pseudonocardia sp. GCM10023141]|uniref:ABC transporter substrate-binding protein n=1 Tax=Pseudonocardia sp. GCM10023141 TaxID=3252653 RepID=UPI00360B005D